MFCSEDAHLPPRVRPRQAQGTDSRHLPNGRWQDARSQGTEESLLSFEYGWKGETETDMYLPLVYVSELPEHSAPAVHDLWIKFPAFGVTVYRQDVLEANYFLDEHLSLYTHEVQSVKKISESVSSFPFVSRTLKACTHTAR